MVMLQGIDRMRNVDVNYQYTNPVEYVEEILDDILDYFGEECLTPEPPAIGDNTLLYVNEFSFENDTKFFLDSYIDPNNNAQICNGGLIENLDDFGKGAQGGFINSNPPAVFVNHAIVKDNDTGKYYDPSYGQLPTNSKMEFENDSFEGFGNVVLIEYKNAKSGTSVRRFYYLHQTNLPFTNQTIINP